VLGLPRGGVIVAAEVAHALGAPLDVFVVRKLGVPGQEELAMGAVASGGVRVLNDDVIHDLGIPESVIDHVTRDEQREIERREAAFRRGAPPPRLENRDVIVVDDGLATGATMLAGVQALRQLRPRRIVAAVPVASIEACEAVSRVADRCVCLERPYPFMGVGAWYERFDQTEDDEVRRALQAPGGAPG
jgi:predicted phosphoribosyltransferase